MKDLFSIKTLLVIAAAVLAACLVIFYKKTLLCVVLLYIFGILYFYILKDFAFWQRNIIILIGGYFILTRGFSYLGLTLGNKPIFIGEIIILLSFILHNFKSSFNALFRHGILKWLLMWILLGLILLVMHLPKFPLISVFRDFAIVYYAIFILFGYAFYQKYHNVTKFFKILGYIFIMNTIWGFFYIFIDFIEAVSPKLMGIMPLFTFRSDANGTIFVGGILYFFLLFKQYGWPKLLSMVLIFLQFSLIMLFQTRAVYVSCLFVYIFLLLEGKWRMIVKSVGILVLILLIAIVLNPEIKKRGTKYYKVNFIEGVTQRFVSIFTPEESGTSRHRLLWYKALFDESFESPKLLFIGRGFGQSLAVAGLEAGDKNRRAEEIAGLAKSPHSILVTIFARMGIIGMVMWLAVNYLFFSYMFYGIKIANKLDEKEMRNNLIWIAGFILGIVGAALFGVLLESPFTAIPYFFFMGLGIAMVDRFLLCSRNYNI
jgi:hypothetical protein